jgi:hypothetical protein
MEVVESSPLVGSSCEREGEGERGCVCMFVCVRVRKIRSGIVTAKGGREGGRERGRGGEEACVCVSEGVGEGRKRDRDSEHQEEERRVGDQFKTDVDPLALAPTDAARFNVADGGIGDVFEL